MRAISSLIAVVDCSQLFFYQNKCYSVVSGCQFYSLWYARKLRLQTWKLFFEITEPLLNVDAALPNSGTQSERSGAERLSRIGCSVTLQSEAELSDCRESGAASRCRAERSGAIVANRVQRHAAERSGVERLSRIDSGGTPLRTGCSVTLPEGYCQNGGNVIL